MVTGPEARASSCRRCFERLPATLRNEDVFSEFSTCIRGEYLQDSTVATVDARGFVELPASPWLGQNNSPSLPYADPVLPL